MRRRHGLPRPGLGRRLRHCARGGRLDRGDRPRSARVRRRARWLTPPSSMLQVLLCGAIVRAARAAAVAWLEPSKEGTVTLAGFIVILHVAVGCYCLGACLCAPLFEGKRSIPHEEQHPFPPLHRRTGFCREARVLLLTPQDPIAPAPAPALRTPYGALWRTPQGLAAAPRLQTPNTSERIQYC